MQSKIYIICWFWTWIIIAYRKFTIVHLKDSIHWRFSRCTKTKSMSSSQKLSEVWKSELSMWWNFFRLNNDFDYFFFHSFCRCFSSENWSVSIWVEMNWHRCRNGHYPFSIISRNWKFRRIKSGASKKVISKVKYHRLFISIATAFKAVCCQSVKVRYQFNRIPFYFYFVLFFVSSPVA